MKQEIKYYCAPDVLALIKDWLLWLEKERGYSSHTVESYGRDLSFFFYFWQQYLGYLPGFSELQAIDVRTFRAFLSQQNQRHLSKSSLARELSSLKSFFHWLNRLHIIDNTAITVISSPKKDKILPKALDIDQTLNLLDAAADFAKDKWQGLRDVAILTILYGCGLRISEALSLNIGDINHNDFLKIKGKGNKERMVPILPIVKEKIAAYLEACPYHQQQGDALFLDIKANPDKYELLLSGGEYETKCGEKKLLVGLKSALAYYTYARLAKNGDGNITRFGFVNKEYEYSNRPEYKEKQIAYNDAFDVASRYMKECIDYLCENREKFPLFKKGVSY